MFESVHRVQNVAEAVALATEFMRNSTHNWFRGQISNWPLKSSYVRLSPEKQEEAMQKLARFEGWVKQAPGLESLAEYVDSMVAVAQHYGLPTNFIDFTTEPEVAGFFASNGNPTEGMKSCILCLDTEDLRDFWKSMSSEYPPPESIHLEVVNLWRLEAQFGTFLFCPYNNFEYIYDLDRIIFPYTGPVAKPTREEIYPRRKSNLEILLDQYFMDEELIEGDRWLEKMGFLRNSFWFGPSPNKCNPELISGGFIPTEQSWSLEAVSQWTTPKTEKYVTAITEDQWEIKINNDKAAHEVGQEISEYVEERLYNDSGVRGKLIKWTLITEADSATSILDTAFLTEALQRLWDGLRTLPYGNEDIAVGIGNCVALYLHLVNTNRNTYDVWLDAASACFGEAIEVELASDDGSYSRAYVSRSALLTAVRDDIDDFCLRTIVAGSLATFQVYYEVYQFRDVIQDV